MNKGCIKYEQGVKYNGLLYEFLKLTSVIMT